MMGYANASDASYNPYFVYGRKSGGNWSDLIDLYDINWRTEHITRQSNHMPPTEWSSKWVSICRFTPGSSNGTFSLSFGGGYHNFPRTSFILDCAYGYYTNSKISFRVLERHADAGLDVLQVRVAKIGDAYGSANHISVEALFRSYSDIEYIISSIDSNAHILAFDDTPILEPNYTTLFPNDTTVTYSNFIDTSAPSTSNTFVQLPYIRYYDLPSQSTNEVVYCKEWIDYLVANDYIKSESDPAKCPIYYARVLPNGQAITLGYCYDGAAGPKTYSGFIFIGMGYISVFGYYNSEFYYKVVYTMHS